MTEEEAQQAFEQQTPVMYYKVHRATGLLSGWRGPVLLSTSWGATYGSRNGVTEGQSVRWLLSDGGIAQARQMRPATPHELLTADEGAQ